MQCYAASLHVSTVISQSGTHIGTAACVAVQVATAVITLMTVFLLTYSFHCTWVTSEAYSSPSIVLSARGGDGGRIIFDDFREAYYWLRYNTAEVGITSAICYVDVQYMGHVTVPLPPVSRLFSRICVCVFMFVLSSCC